MLVKEAKRTLTRWISSQVVYAPDPKVSTSGLEETRNKAKGLIEFSIGYKYDFSHYLDNGARMMGGKFEKIYWLLKTLDHVKYYRKIELTKILRNERAG